ncbi:response regulator [Puniceibacterium sediminis]|uniref:DNA-binding response regulator, OmpR family, contains REC and winged-helix (WHTH) domain n=1 Tax=Puniceibacterium sediminis TaxID=1608407 RepID=A0A238ZPD2_9RHOB|nr:response regulator [Puniceibacterium sediminis]SNR84911.1 DNA-binding response regulator, OmpR family, contains REC and winged-helix (wHTH) domain [Puniceibacterium sediminis]
MTQKTVLVVDDDPKVRVLLRRCLESDGFLVDEAENGSGVRAAFAESLPDLVTLDLNLGNEDGLDVAREIRRSHDVPIIMVTGKDDVIDRIVGLELGADDYLTKPFHVREVLARVRSVLRRSEGRSPVNIGEVADTPSDDTLLYLDGLIVDQDRMTITDRDGRDCDLTTADFKLLCAFLSNAKRPLSRDRLMDLIDGADWAPLDRTIDNQVARLRKKIERDPARPLLIKTVRGIGYMLTESAVEDAYRSSSTA